MSDVKAFSKDDEVFDGLVFAALACSKDKTRSLTKICVNMDVNGIKAVYGCDGARLHIWYGEIKNIASGYYDVIKRTKTKIQIQQVEKKDLVSPYPNVEVVMRKDMCKRISFEDMYSVTYGKEIDSCICRVIHTGAFFKLKHLKEAMGFETVNNLNACYWSELNMSFKFLGDSWESHLMPIVRS